MSKPEDRRPRPMVNGNPGPARVFWVVDNFDGTRNRYVGHGLLAIAAHRSWGLPIRARASKRPNAAVEWASCQDLFPVVAEHSVTRTGTDQIAQPCPLLYRVFPVPAPVVGVGVFTWSRAPV